MYGEVGVYYYIHVHMWLCGVYVHAFVGPPSTCVCVSEYICHGRVTVLTLASEAMPGHWLPAFEWGALRLRAYTS